MEMSARSTWLLLEGPPAARSARVRATGMTASSLWLLLEGPAAARAAGRPGIPSAPGRRTRGSGETSRKGPVRRAAAVAALLLSVASPTAAQDGNVFFPADTIENRLTRHTFDIVGARGSRFEGDRTQQKQLAFGDGVSMLVKWAAAPGGGEEFNNNPRYELAAYEIQKLFLDPGEYVVPPTAVRWLPLGWYRREVDPDARETLRGTGAVLVALQYWLWNVEAGEIWDRDRLEADTAYARGIGNLNLLTYLVRHMDSNEGNFLLSRDPDRPRAFSVDNGVAFRSERSDRGDRWRRLRVERLPRGAVDRLREVSLEDLRRRLGVLATFENRGAGRLVPGETTENLDRGKGFRREERAVQLGLTDREIRDVWGRLERLLEDVDRGDLRLF